MVPGAVARSPAWLLSRLLSEPSCASRGKAAHAGPSRADNERSEHRLAAREGPGARLSLATNRRKENPGQVMHSKTSCFLVSDVSPEPSVMTVREELRVIGRAVAVAFVVAGVLLICALGAVGVAAWKLHGVPAYCHSHTGTDDAYHDCVHQRSNLGP